MAKLVAIPIRNATVATLLGFSLKKRQLELHRVFKFLMHKSFCRSSTFIDGRLYSYRLLTLFATLPTCRETQSKEKRKDDVS